MRYLSISEVLELHERLISSSGGSTGIRDLGAVGHAAMETFLILNGAVFDCSVNKQERVMLDLVAGIMDRAEFTDWVKHTTE